MIKYRNSTDIIVGVFLACIHGFGIFHVVDWSQKNTDDGLMLFMVAFLGIATMSIALMLAVAIMQIIWCLIHANIIRMLHRFLSTRARS